MVAFQVRGTIDWCIECVVQAVGPVLFSLAIFLVLTVAYSFFVDVVPVLLEENGRCLIAGKGYTGFDASFSVFLECVFFS